MTDEQEVEHENILMCAEHDRALSYDGEGHFGFCHLCGFHPDMQSTYILKKHRHVWEHLGGAAFGMYRCKQCCTFGYRMKERMGKSDLPWSIKIKPYTCVKCSGWAVAKDKIWNKFGKTRFRREWRCRNHREIAGKKLGVDTAS